MKKPLLSFILLLSIPLLGCSGIQVSQDYDISMNFSDLKTYTWQTTEQEKTGDIRIDNPLLDKRIREAVEHALIEKGYQNESQTKPNFYVAYKMTIQKRLETDNVSTGIGFGFGTYGRRGGVSVSTGGRVNEYDEALLVVDIINSENNELLWRGTSTSRVSQHSTPEKTTESINRTIAKIMEQFPPE
ncbi:DUF4136 domain-containing protein [Thermodesulfobacteriota bacterium]